MRAHRTGAVTLLAGGIVLAAILRQLRLRRRWQRRRRGASARAAADGSDRSAAPAAEEAGLGAPLDGQAPDSEPHRRGPLARWSSAAAALLGGGGGARVGGGVGALKSPQFGNTTHWPGSAQEAREAASSAGLGLLRRARARTLPAAEGGGKVPTADLRRGGLTAQQAQLHASERAAAAAAAGHAPHDAGLASAAEAPSVRFYFGLDIGGSLAKIVHFEPHQKPKAALRRLAAFIRGASTYQTGVRDVHLQLGALSGTLHFIRFETRRMDAFLSLVRAERLHAGAATIYATGGGAHKFAPDFERELGVKLEKLDELACCVKGVTWLLQQVSDELFEYRDKGGGGGGGCGFGQEAGADRESSTGEAMEAVPYAIPAGGTYPFILVNIGSGVSILRVKAEDDFERISGTAVGGGTFLGLCRLLGCGDTFDEALENAAGGDDGKVNLLVEDIYGGGGYDAFGLPPKLIASMFGKVLRRDDPYEGVGKADVCRALLVMISQVIAQVAYLSAENSGVHRLVFSGTFLHSNQIALRTLAYHVSRWSRGSVPALFLKHEGYSGALGAFLFSATLEQEYGVGGGASDGDGTDDDGEGDEAGPAAADGGGERAG